jgi:hypothetical protein
MPTIEVVPRPTPEERYDASVSVEVDEGLSIFAATLEDWVTPRQGWQFTLREGTDFDRPNNVEGHVVLAAGEQTSELLFRLDQLVSVDETTEELVLVFEEQDGVAKLARLRMNGLAVELFHILTYT